jgi:hypothetical protein
MRVILFVIGSNKFGMFLRRFLYVTYTTYIYCKVPLKIFLYLCTILYAYSCSMFET